jgi:hypothetical protein
MLKIKKKCWKALFFPLDCHSLLSIAESVFTCMFLAVSIIFYSLLLFIFYFFVGGGGGETGSFHTLFCILHTVNCTLIINACIKQKTCLGK